MSQVSASRSVMPYDIRSTTKFRTINVWNRTKKITLCRDEIGLSRRIDEIFFNMVDRCCSADSKKNVFTIRLKITLHDAYRRKLVLLRKGQESQLCTQFVHRKLLMTLINIFKKKKLLCTA